MKAPSYEQQLSDLAVINEINLRSYEHKMYFRVGRRSVTILRVDVFQLNKEQLKSFFQTNVADKLH